MFLQLADNQNFISWTKFRPTTREDILAHYYANSTGTVSPGFARLFTALAQTIGIFFGVPQAGAMVDQALKKYRTELVAMMVGNKRAKYDSSYEKDRIVSVYNNYYKNPTYQSWMNTFVNKTPAECLASAQGLKSGNLAGAISGCKKGDTSACRWMGLINCQIQYLTLLAEEKRLALIPPQDRPAPPPMDTSDKSGIKNIALAIGILSALS